MLNPKTDIAQAQPHPEPRMLVTSAALPTPGEAAAFSGRWERRGLLRRLVRVDRARRVPSRTKGETPAAVESVASFET